MPPGEARPRTLEPGGQNRDPVRVLSDEELQACIERARSTCRALCQSGTALSIGLRAHYASVLAQLEAEQRRRRG